MHDVKKKEHDNNQQHKTQDVDNGVRPGETTALGLGVKMVQDAALSVEKSEDVHACVFSIIQGICPHAGVALREVPPQKLSFKKDSYQYDIISHMKIMSISPTWQQRDLNSDIHGDNMSIPST